MKNLSLLLLLCLIFVSCTKGGDDGASSSATFSITGVQDVDLTTNSTASATIPISVISTSGTPETVSLFVDGLPEGVFANIVPSSGTTPFNARVVFWNDFSGTGGTYPVTLVGRSSSGSRSYKLNVTLDYKGWKFNGGIYKQTGLIKEPGSASHYPQIKVFGGGGAELTINFGMGKSLPTVTRTYKITSSSGTSDDIQISMFDNPLIFISTGVEAPTGTFTFDSLGKFTFKCKNVEMTNGTEKKLLDCSFSE